MSSKVLLVLACVLFFGVSGCADLPDVAALAGSVTDRAKTPDLIDTDGSVPNQRVCEILLANAAASSGMLQDHLPVAAAISTAPLVAGNRTTLLHEGRAIEQAVLRRHRQRDQQHQYRATSLPTTPRAAASRIC